MNWIEGFAKKLNINWSFEIDRLSERMQEVEKRNLDERKDALRMVIMTEQKIENPCAPFKLFHTVLLVSVDIQLEVTKR